MHGDTGCSTTTTTTSSVECWLCGRSCTVVELDGSGCILVPMVNCDGCGCLLDKEWLDSRIVKLKNQSGWEEVEYKRHAALRGTDRVVSGTQPLGHVILGIVMAGLVMVHLTIVYLGTACILIPDILFDLFPHHRWLFNGLVLEHIVSLGIYGCIVILYWNVTKNHPGRVLLGDMADTANIGYSWCHRCDFVKPPDAHHCRRCGTCVYNMDHHCMYTANTCIGQDNMAHFLRFLWCLVVGSGTSSLVAMLYAWVFRDRLLHLCSISWVYAHQSSIPGVFHHVHFLHLFAYNWVVSSSTLSDLIWLDSFVISIAACMGSTMILYRQLILQAAGTTYLKESSRRRTTKTKTKTKTKEF